MSEFNIPLTGPPAPIIKEIVSEDKKQGRPLGAKNKAAKFKHYKPKKWHPWMTSLVLHHCSGRTNTDLAQMFEITPEHVSNILSTENAGTIREEFKKQILSTSPDIADKMARVASKAFGEMENFLGNEVVKGQSPLAFVDRAMRIFDMTFPVAHPEIAEKGISRHGDTNINIQQNVFLANREFIERITKGLEDSNRIAVIHNETRQKLLTEGNAETQQVRENAKTELALVKEAK